MQGVDVWQSGARHTLYSAQPGLLQGHSVAQVLARPLLLLMPASLSANRDRAHTPAQVVQPQPSSKRRSPH